MSTAASSLPQPCAEPEVPNPRSAQASHPSHPPMGQDPGLAHPQLVHRPLFYMHAPPPPFMQYQWPMPFYHNPFNPFPGMGYSMMMPPFPPLPYMDPPAYFLPHAPVQPMDYRRTHPNSAPYPNPSQNRRARPVHTRETVNIEVQTDYRGAEFHQRSPRTSSTDSGRETALNSPTSSTSSRKKSESNVENAPKDLHLTIARGRSNANGGLEMEYQREEQNVQPVVMNKSLCWETRGVQLVNSPASSTPSQEPANVENCEAAEDLQLSISCVGNGKPGLSTSNPEERHLKKGQCPLNSLSLPGDVHLRQEQVMDSAGKDISEKRRASVPDILLSWGNGPPQVDKTANDNHENLALCEKFDQSSTAVNEEQLEAEGDVEERNVGTSLRYEAFERSLNISIKLCDTEHSRKGRHELDESIWSVESLPLYVPTKEWLMHNITAGNEVILETAEEAENGAADSPGSRESSADSVQLSNSCFDFSTPATETNVEAGEPHKYKMQNSILILDSPISKQKSAGMHVKEIDKQASEPEGSLKRLSFTVEENGEKDKLYKIVLMNEAVQAEVPGGVAEDLVLASLHIACEDKALEKKTLGEQPKQCLVVPDPPPAAEELSPSRGNLVDCGVQCPDLQTRNNLGMSRKHHFYSDVPNVSTHSDGFVFVNGPKKRYNHSRNKGPYRPHSQQDVYYDGYKPGKQRGGKGRC